MLKYIIFLGILFFASVFSAPFENAKIYSFEDNSGKIHDIPLDLNFELENPDSEPLFSIEKDVSLNLYTRKNTDVPYLLLANETVMKNAPINKKNPTKFVIHGWTENGDKRWLKAMKDKYLINGEYNVILVDWEKHATVEYTIAARRTRKVGAYVGAIIVALNEYRGVDFKDVHIAGHSLGAHVAADCESAPLDPASDAGSSKAKNVLDPAGLLDPALQSLLPGFAGKLVLKLKNKKIGRITGLDPARPLFELPLVSEDKRLCPEDAEFVDIIHTCAGDLGFSRSIGHADFFPNQGKNIQNGCGIIGNIVCSHARSYKYYMESINTKNFLATSCKSWKQFKKGKCDGNEVQIFGLHTSVKARGSYFLHTNKKSPFAKGK